MEKLSLIHNVSCLHPMRFQINNTALFVKRDDTLDFAFGGNKVRFFEYLAMRIQRSGAEKVITFGSVHSNFVRVTACVCQYLGLACDLLILTEDGTLPLSPNLKLLHYCAHTSVHACKTAEAHEEIDRYLAEQEARGISFFWIPGGGHIFEASLGYVDAAHEILQQLESNGTAIDALFLPCGTGTTQAGLIYGLRDKIPVYGVSVARSVERCRMEILSLLLEMEKFDKAKKTDYDWERYIHVLPKREDTSYGERDQQTEALIREIAQSDGFFLDPVYNAKSFLQMREWILSNPKVRNVLYLNTGGTPNLFA